MNCDKPASSLSDCSLLTPFPSLLPACPLCPLPPADLVPKVSRDGYDHARGTFWVKPVSFPFVGALSIHRDGYDHSCGAFWVKPVSFSFVGVLSIHGDGYDHACGTFWVKPVSFSFVGVLSIHGDGYDHACGTFWVKPVSFSFVGALSIQSPGNVFHDSWQRRTLILVLACNPCAVLVVLLSLALSFKTGFTPDLGCNFIPKHTRQGPSQLPLV